jgi:hypothetical protein
MDNISKFENDTIISLIKGTEVVLDFIETANSREKIDFVSTYNNFYYYEALDGHEATKEESVILEKYAPLVEFHREIQIEIVNNILIDKELSRLPNQISEEEALVKIIALTKRFEATELLSKLKDST